jgi:hypothetical protein|tara:strand:+ start:233 stop:727 length:495 start_codon:yes stop_codon:yes gene_type:complete
MLVDTMGRHVFKNISKFVLTRERGHGSDFCPDVSHILLLWNDRMVVDRFGYGWIHWFHLVKVRLSIWVRRHSSSSSFDLRTLETLAEKQLSAKEAFMVIGSAIRSFGDTVETVEVQLPLKGGVFLLLEEPGKTSRMLREEFGLVYNETAAVRLPRDDMRKFRLD